MQQFAYFDKEEIICEPNIIEEKRLMQSEFFCTNIGAKLLTRDAPLIFDSLMKEIIDGVTNGKIRQQELVDPSFRLSEEEL